MAALEDSQAAQRAAAAEAERARLAADVHDVLAHTLSGLALQLEGATLLAATTPTDPRLVEAVRRAHRLSRSGLTEARRAVGALRGDRPPGPGDIPALVEEHRLASAGAVAFRQTGDPVALPAEVGAALYRAAQEALSNVRKHAGNAAVEVHLAWDAQGGVELTVADSGGEAARERRRGRLRPVRDGRAGACHRRPGHGGDRRRQWLPCPRGRAVSRSEAEPGGGDVAAAMAAVPRSEFLPRPQRRFAAVDLALPIGAPPDLLAALHRPPDARAARRPGRPARAGRGCRLRLDHRPAGLAGRPLRDGRGGRARAVTGAVGRRHVAAAGLPWARVERAAPGRLGWPQEAPYDRILVSAEADAVPAELERQLTGGGVMVLPVSGRLLRLRAGAPGAPGGRPGSGRTSSCRCVDDRMTAGPGWEGWGPRTTGASHVQQPAPRGRGRRRGPEVAARADQDRLLRRDGRAGPGPTAGLPGRPPAAGPARGRRGGDRPPRGPCAPSSVARPSSPTGTRRRSARWS